MRKYAALIAIFVALVAGLLTTDWSYLWRCAPPCSLGFDLTYLWFYPPLMNWFFFWLDAVSLRTASLVWCLVIFLGITTSLFIWGSLCSGKRRLLPVVFSLLLIGQYPVFFAMKQGNADVQVILCYSLGVLLFCRRSYFFAGFFLGLSIMLKVYPVVPVAILAAGLMLRSVKDKRTRKILAAFLPGVIFACAAVFLISTEENFRFFSQTLPYYMKRGGLRLSPSITASRHSGQFLGMVFPVGGELLMISLTAAWVLAAIKSTSHNSVRALAGLLAISTYYQGSAFDYNLTTTYPLLLVLFIQASRIKDYLFILAGLLVIIGPRPIWLELAQLDWAFDWLPTALSILWLTLVPIRLRL